MSLGGFATKKEKALFARGPNESDENILKDMEEAFGLQGLSLEGLQLFRRCSDTTSAQREPPRQPQTKGYLEAVQLKMKEKQTIDAAWKIWSATAQIQVRPEWKKQLQREGIAAGLFMPTMFNQEEAKARFRISPAPSRCYAPCMPTARTPTSRSPLSCAGHRCRRATRPW